MMELPQTLYATQNVLRTMNSLLEPLNLQIKIVVDSAGLQFNQNVSGNLYLPIQQFSNA